MNIATINADNFVTVKATKNEIRRVLNDVDYSVFRDVYNDKTGKVKEKMIDEDLLFIFNSMAQANHNHTEFNIVLEVGVTVTNIMTVPGVVAIIY